MKSNVHIVSLNIVPFVPFVYGLLRVAAETDPVVAANYEFQEPHFFSHLKPTEIVERLERPAVLALSCYIWNFRKHMKIARLCKERHPNTLVVAGGPQVPDRVGDFFTDHPYVDILIHGEGELPFRGVLRERIADSPNWDAIPGVSFVRNGVVVSTKSERMQVQEVRRSPYLAGYLDKSMEVYRSMNVDFYAPWETNRGCPYSCSFCDWGASTMSKIRQFDLERLLQEVDFFGEHKIPLLHINDANFGILKRDSEIAERIVEARRKHGFPREVRVNFAKNSNNRVFEISKSWNATGLLNATTLSMQATNKDVLAAIARENIPVDRYRDIQRRYTDATIRTYTEVILGLPHESRETFKRGLDDVLEMGNHDDVRVYPFVILPNAPVAEPESIARHGLKIVEKELATPRFPGASETPADEVETMPTVFETNTMSLADWVDCSVYARMLQFLHSGHLTRYLAMHLRRHYGLPYHAFYEGIQRYFLERPDSVLGRMLGTFEDFYRREHSTTRAVTVDWSRVPAESLAAFGKRPFFVAEHDYAWLCITARQEIFFAEIADFVSSLKLPLGEEMTDLLRYQKDVLLHPEYDPALGKRGVYEHDFPTYFATEAALVRRPVRIHFRDTHTGPTRELPLEPANLKAFVKAAVPGFSSVNRGFYGHQLDVAEIRYQAGDGLPIAPAHTVKDAPRRLALVQRG